MFGFRLFLPFRVAFFCSLSISISSYSCSSWLCDMVRHFICCFCRLEMETFVGCIEDILCVCVRCNAERLNTRRKKEAPNWWEKHIYTQTDTPNEIQFLFSLIFFAPHLLRSVEKWRWKRGKGKKKPTSDVWQLIHFSLAFRCFCSSWCLALCPFSFSVRLLENGKKILGNVLKMYIWLRFSTFSVYVCLERSEEFEKSNKMSILSKYVQSVSFIFTLRA